jgi:molybdopterin converting factor small subunit
MSSEDSVTVKIPEPLRDCVGGQRELSVEPGTIADIIVQMGAKYPEIGRQLVTEEGQIARATVIGVDGEDIMTVNGLETGVDPGQTVVIITALPV